MVSTAGLEHPCKLQGFGTADGGFSIYSSQPCHISQTPEVPAVFSAPPLDPEGCLYIPVPGMLLLVLTPSRTLAAFRFLLDFL